jgi:murein DD-endopeptidase MepM/ murein hydrolase activator NlpD
VQDPERNTPIDGAPTGGVAAGVGDLAESAPSVVETPQTGVSSSRSLADPERDRAARKWKDMSPLARAALAIAGGAALLGAALAPLLLRSGPPGAVTLASAAPLAASLAGLETFVEAGAASTIVDPAVDAGSARAPVWRVAQLADEESVKLVEAVVGRRPLLAALTAARLSHGEAQRLTNSLAATRGVERFGPKDALTIALDKSSDRVVAYELVTSPADVWQGREHPQPDGSTRLETRKLELVGERVRVGKAVLVGADLRASLVEAGLAPVDELLAMLDDALEGHAELSDIRPGARLRVVATQEQVEGTFVRWVSLEAVEYFPAAPSAPSVRVYSFGDDEATGDAKRHHGWYDVKGRQPYHGGFRTPVPLARLASRFNPHRMHPVLHVVMPHNGVDFAAPIGAPVYATAAGVVTSVGYEGPCGNKVEISHVGGVTSIYCHLSRFASGLHAGLHVEQRQLIAYVGQTGRVTGPHLHFGIRRGGVFVDPMTLRLDGVRVVPRALRDEFDRRRAELDAALDEIPLPASGGVVPEANEPETFYEEP